MNSITVAKSLFKRVEMEEVYKRHIIRSGAAAMRGSIEWKPIAQINWTEEGKEHVGSGWNGSLRAILRPPKTPKEKRMFSPKDWIDNRNPNLA